jgi:hypothetical protein
VIRVTLFASFILLAITGSAQIKTAQLPSFYDQAKSGDVISIDMVSNGFDPVVVYISSKSSSIKSKKWDEDKWTDFGDFPKVKNCDLVKLKYWNNTYHTLVKGSEGWSVYTKDNTASSWTVLGEENFAPVNAFLDPIISFNDTTLIIFEHWPSSVDLVAYTLMDGRLQLCKSSTCIANEVILSDYNYACNSKGESILTYKIATQSELKIYKVIGSAKPKPLLKGLNPKDIDVIVNLKSKNDDVYLTYVNYVKKLKFAKLDENSKKWTMLDFNHTISSTEFSFARNMSFVTIPNDSSNPVFYEFKDDKWDEGEKLDITKISNEKPIILRKTVGKYFLLYFENSDKPVVQLITNY